VPHAIEVISTRRQGDNVFTSLLVDHFYQTLSVRVEGESSPRKNEGGKPDGFSGAMGPGGGELVTHETAHLLDLHREAFGSGISGYPRCRPESLGPGTPSQPAPGHGRGPGGGHLSGVPGTKFPQPLQARSRDGCSTASALVAGLGGLGGMLAVLLARVGVGRLLLADGDVFVPSNLNRQFLASQKNLGKKKAQATADHLRDINPALLVEAIPDYLTPDNLTTIFPRLRSRLTAWTA
jgi:hypothetical protein